MSLFSVLLLVCALSASLLPGRGDASESTLDDEPAPESVEQLRGSFGQAFRERIRRRALFPRLKNRFANLPPFLRDSEVVANPRSYYFSRRDLDDDRQNATAFGGSLLYRSGLWRERLSIGATVFSSWKLVGKDRHDGSRLLRTGQRSYSVVGHLFARLKHEEHELTLYRQELDLPYVNKRDNRMTPNTFEGYTFRGNFPRLQYGVGHLTRMKKQDEDRFRSMSESAGVPGSTSKGLSFAGMRYAPSDAFMVGVINYFGKDYLNIFYTEAAYTRSLPNRLGLKVSAQFTDQRSVGDDLLTGRDFDTYVGGARLALSYEGAILTLAFSTVDDEERIRSPFGSYVGYLSLMQRNFFRADEDAWLVGLSYNFRRLGWKDLSLFANFARGVGARDADTDTPLGDRTELDLTIDYKISEGRWRGLWLRVRGSILKEDGANERSKEVRIIINYEIPTL